MKYILPIWVLISVPFFASAQKFYVNTSCPRCDVLITKKLDKLGYLATIDSSAAAYFIRGVFTKERAYISLKLKQQESGYLNFTNPDGKVIASTRPQKGNAAALNGFDAKADVTRKIVKKDFYAIIKNLPKQ